MLVFIGNLAPLEIVVIVVIAILVFGRRLPEVAGRFLYQLRRLRQSMYDLRRETGIDQELRNVERSMRKAAWEAEARAAKEIEAEEIEADPLDPSPATGATDLPIIGEAASENTPEEPPGEPDKGSEDRPTPDPASP